MAQELPQDFSEFLRLLAERAADATIGGTPVRVISLGDLRRNKHASGRHKDLDDLEHLPES